MIPAAALLLALLWVASGFAADARAAVDAFVSRLRGIDVIDLAVVQTFTIYHPDGRDIRTTGEQRLFVKIPGRQRIEETLEGRRAVRLVVDNHVWVRRADGRVYEAPPLEVQQARSHLLSPFGRTATDLLAEWRTHGVRDDLASQARIGDRLVTVIGARSGDRARPAVWLDPERGVVRFIAREQVPGGDALIDLTLSDHRRLVNGLFYPFRQELFLDGKLLTRVTVRSVEVNGHLGDDLFDPEALRRGR